MSTSSASSSPATTASSTTSASPSSPGKVRKVAKPKFNLGLNATPTTTTTAEANSMCSATTTTTSTNPTTSSTATENTSSTCTKTTKSCDTGSTGMLSRNVSMPTPATGASSTSTSTSTTTTSTVAPTTPKPSAARKISSKPKFSLGGGLSSASAAASSATPSTSATETTTKKEEEEEKTASSSSSTTTTKTETKTATESALAATVSTPTIPRTSSSSQIVGRSATSSSITAGTSTSNRRPRPKLPSMALDLGLNEGAPPGEEIVDISASAVSNREAEHLIVEFEAMDSPFIATIGQFPGMGSTNNSAASYGSTTSSLTSQSSGGGRGGGFPGKTLTSSSSADNVFGVQKTSNSNNNKKQSASASVAAKQQPSSQKKKFFRIDESNLFVFVDDSDTRDSQHDLSERNRFAGVETSSGGNGGSGSGSGSDGGGIPFEELTIGNMLGSGAQGSVYAVSHKKQNFALKKISITDALDRGQAAVERQARKNGIVRELQMVAARQDHCPFVVHLHNAYFRKDSEENASNLYILMERMSISIEDLQHYAARLPRDEVTKSAQRCFGDKIAGIPVEGIKVDRKTLTAKECVAAHAQRSTALPEIVIACIAADALKGLHFLHSGLRLVHTDLKPANLMLNENMELTKIADFGCSQQLSNPNKNKNKIKNSSSNSEDNNDSNSNTNNNNNDVNDASSGENSSNSSAGNKKKNKNKNQNKSDDNNDNNDGEECSNCVGGEIVVSNVVLGTKLYMSPERARASYGGFDNTVSFNEKADIWAFGMMILELATGCHPCEHFREEYWNFAAMLKWSELTKPESMPIDFIDFLRRCLDVEPSTRASAAELLKHDFIRRFERTDRRKLATFIRSIRTQASEAERKRLRSSLQDHVKKVATLKVDVKRVSTQKWQGFQKGIVGNVPDTKSEEAFPALG